MESRDTRRRIIRAATRARGGVRRRRMELRRMGRAMDGVSEMVGSGYTCDWRTWHWHRRWESRGTLVLGQKENRVRRGYGWNGEWFLA
jgi:hypothetical protein